MYLYEHKLKTQKPQQMIKITNSVREDLQKSGIKEGIAVIFSTHTTAGFTINENADPNVVKDMLFGGEGVFNTVISGPGHIWLQTMPISNVAGVLAPFLPVAK